MNRKLLQMVGAASLAGVTLAACGTTVHTSKTTPKAPVSSKQAPSSPTSIGVPPANAPVGFNTSRTAFVLPYHLGYLPAPELALAKSDPAYAAGLANLKDWINVLAPGGSGPALPSSSSGRFYLGNAGQQTNTRGTILGEKTDVPTMWSFVFNTKPASIPTSTTIQGVATSSTTSISVRASQLGTIPPNPMPTLIKSMPNKGYTIITPSTLEVRAAPVGTLTVHGTAMTAFCVPSPEAIIHNGQVVTPSGLSPITAGPSTIFAMPGASTSTLYDQGATSCASFS